MIFPEQLIEGYRNFRESRFPTEYSRFRLLAKAGQRPKVMLIGCCDSRSAPEVIFDAAPGEIFVLRNVANLVPPYHPDQDHHGTSAALEFAILALKVQHIVVMGHEKCGGVKAALDIVTGEAEPLSHGDFIGNWISMLASTAAAVRDDTAVAADCKYTELEHRAILLSLKNLLTFPWIKSAVEAGELKLHGAWFDIANGELHVLNSKGQFVTV
jgi:carbonic anhydrase